MVLNLGITIRIIGHLFEIYEWEISIIPIFEK